MGERWGHPVSMLKSANSDNASGEGDANFHETLIAQRSCANSKVGNSAFRAARERTM